MNCGSKQPLKSCLRGSSGGSASGGAGGGGSSHSSASSGRISSRSSGGGRFSVSSCGGGGSRSSCGGGAVGYGSIRSSSYGGGMSSRSWGGGMGGGYCGGGMGTGFRSGGSRFGAGYGGGFGGGGAGFSGGSFGFHGGNVGILSNDEKLTMQSLNERLASYMEMVRNLETENAQLEQLIREWYQEHGSAGPKDYSQYYGQIEELQNQIVAATVETHKVLLDLDNTKMTAEDFRLKYETECGLRQNVEADLNSLRPLLDSLTLSRSDLEMQFESLKEEMIDLKKNHEEEMKQLQSQSSGDVSVKVNAAPGEDLLKKLNEMRQEYEAIIQKNRAEVEKWYESKMEEVSQQVHSSGQEVESSNQQISELRREFQALEIELQSQISMIDSLQSNLEDTERRYNMQLHQIQGMIGPLEEELASIRCEMESQNEEYKMLLGIKTRLEQEIQEYRALLEKGQHGLRYRISHSQGGAGGGSSGGGGGHGGGSSEGRTGGSYGRSSSSESGGGGNEGRTGGSYGRSSSSESAGGGSEGRTGGSYGRSSSSESGGGGSGGRTGGGTCGKTSGGGCGSGGGGGGKSCLSRSSSSQSQPGDSSESPGGAENMKLCLEGNKTLERGATMEEVSNAIKHMRRGSFRKSEE